MCVNTIKEESEYSGMRSGQSGKVQGLELMLSFELVNGFGFCFDCFHIFEFDFDFETEII